MNDVDVTVIIPTFRRPELLPQAIASALSQEGVSLEVCVVDDSPEGSARDVALGLRDPRVTYRKLHAPSNGRPAIVRNDAWPTARGRYVHFLDDDDIVVAGAYRAHVRALDAPPNLARFMSFGCIEPFGADPEAVRLEALFWRGGADRARRAATLGRLGFVAAMLFDHAVLQNSACMVRTSALREIGGFDPLMPLQEDTEMHARGTRLRGCVFIDRTVVRYRVSPTSLMRRRDPRGLLDEAYARMHRKYRHTHGLAEYMALKFYARGGSALARLRPSGWLQRSAEEPQD
jgi:glycosyltransferase involved in cell wall biosynthesis